MWGVVFGGLLILVLLAIGSGLFALKPRPLAYLLDLSDLPFTAGRKREPVSDLPTAELASFVQSELERQTAPGGAVALLRPNIAPWVMTYGLRDVTQGLPVTADTPFALGSVSKTFIAVALMQAVEAGHLALDTQINTVLPFAVTNPQVDPALPITVWHLATHTSGIQDHTWTYATKCYQPQDAPNQLGSFLKDYLSPDGAYYSPKQNFLEAQPGAVIEYSNVASALLAYVIECAVQMSFAAYTQREIFEPLQMSNTAWFVSEFSDPSQVAMRYSRLQRPYGHLGSLTWPDGFLHSSITDLSRFLTAIMNKGELDGVRILSEASVETMLRPQLPDIPQDDGEAQALIWSMENGLIGHNGGDPGVFTLMYIDPETDRGAIVLLNSMTGTSIRAAGNILRQALAVE